MEKICNRITNAPIKDPRLWPTTLFTVTRLFQQEGGSLSIDYPLYHIPDSIQGYKTGLITQLVIWIQTLQCSDILVGKNLKLYCSVFKMYYKKNYSTLNFTYIIEIQLTQYLNYKVMLFVMLGHSVKRSTLPPQRKFLPSGGGREKNCFR